MENENTTTDSTAPRPFGYWLRAVDRLLAQEFETAFEAEGVTRRDWRLLSLLDGDVVAPEITERLQRHGGKKLRPLIERGWVAEDGDGWTLTDEGRAAKARLGEVVAGIRARVAGTVSDEDFATTLATLEAIATELGWDPDERMPRGRGRGSGHGHRGFDRGFRPGFHPGHEGFGPRFGEGYGPESERECRHGGPHGQRHHGEGHGHYRGHGDHAAQHAYERGFDAGFSRGAEAHGA